MTSEQIDSLWTISDPVTGFEKLNQALEANPDSADEIHTQICRSFGLQRRFEDAWAELAKVSETTSDIVKIRVKLESGRLKNSSGDKKAAITLFQMALDLAAQTNFDFYAVDAAHMLGITTDGAESVQWNEQALALAAASKDARTRNWRGSLLNNLGWAYHDAGDFAKALEKFEEVRAFREEAGQPVELHFARWAVARCLRSLTHNEEALTILHDLGQSQEDAYVSVELGENLLALGRREEAKPHFRKAFELLSKDPYLKEIGIPRLKRLEELAS